MNYLDDLPDDPNETRVLRFGHRKFFAGAFIWFLIGLYGMPILITLFLIML